MFWEQNELTEAQRKAFERAKSDLFGQRDMRDQGNPGKQLKLFIENNVGQTIVFLGNRIH